ncbi:MAG: replication-associated recombination protein A [Candidatus Omnitrophota bacterium]
MEEENTIFQSKKPLAVRMRPKKLDDIVGQRQVLGEGKMLKRAIRAKTVNSVILYGPAGCGKTTLGSIIANEINAEFEYLNAAFSSVAEVKKVIEKIKKRRLGTGKRTVLFIDEIHRFSKLQQETLVPDTENGTIIFVGATIYTPYYYLIPSIISRSIIAKFVPLTKEDIIALLARALVDKTDGLGMFNVKVTNKALEYIAGICGGDARKALSALELGVMSLNAGDESKVFDLQEAKECIQKDIFYDKKDGYHYDTISAFIKSVRGSDVDASLYWLAKMIKTGEDPRFIARRLLILASEDIGNANPMGLVLANSCFSAVERIGYPEARIILGQAVVYLAASPKSNRAYEALTSALDDIEREETKEVPDNIKTHSSQYKYSHSYQKEGIGGYVEQDYGVNKKYYFPLDVGEEKKIKEFLDSLK